MSEPAAAARSAVPPPLGHQLRVLTLAAWRQAARQNEIYVLLLLLGLYAAGALVLRIVGIESVNSARFVRGLGLQLGSALSAGLAIISAARALPPELEQRTIYPVLAKPLSRGALLLGKGLPAWLISCAAMLLFTLATLLISPGLSYQQPAVLGQALALKACSLAMVTALGLALSLWLPLAVNLLVTAGLVFGGGTLANVLAQAPRPLSWLGLLLPDFSLLGHFMRYTDGGGALGGGLLAGLAVYAAAWCGLLAALAWRRFNRMAL